MTGKELFEYLTKDAGYDEATTKILMQAAENAKVQERASALKSEQEYRALVSELDGVPDRPGTRAYAKWYQENYGKIQEIVNAKASVETQLAHYQERFGALDGTPTPASKAAGAVPDEESLKRLVDQRIQEQYSPQWSNLLKGSGRLIEKHLRAKRDTEIDWDKISELAAKNGGNLGAAYDEWDAPEREKSLKSAEDSRVEKRVKEELQKQMAAKTREFFPAGADGTPSDSPLSRRSGSDGKPPAYDRQAVIDAAVTGEYSGFEGKSEKPASGFFN